MSVNKLIWLCNNKTDKNITKKYDYGFVGVYFLVVMSSAPSD